MIKCGLDQNSQVYLGWELGTDKHEVALFMRRLSGNAGGEPVPRKESAIFRVLRQASIKGLHLTNLLL